MCRHCGTLYSTFSFRVKLANVTLRGVKCTCTELKLGTLVVYHYAKKTAKLYSFVPFGSKVMAVEDRQKRM